MAERKPASLWFWNDWRRDPELSRCSKAAKGVWMDMLSLAYQCEQPGIFATAGQAWAIEEIARAIGGDVPENCTLVQELIDKGVARRAESGAIYCRRMVQDEEDYEKEKAGTRERVRRLRDRSNGSVCNATVTPIVTEEKRPSTEDAGVCVTELAFNVLSTKELKSLVDKAFASYCRIFRRNPKQYSLTDKRRRKAELRFIERFKVHDGNIEAVEAEATHAFTLLAGSDFHQSNGFIDWEDQFFRSDEEYQKRITMKPQGTKNHGNGSITSKADQRSADIRESTRRVFDEARSVLANDPGRLQEQALGTGTAVVDPGAVPGAGKILDAGDSGGTGRDGKKPALVRGPGS